MRITTQMVNESARKAGLPTNSVSLLNYVNGDSGNSLIEVLNKKSNTASNIEKKGNYEKLDEEAAQLTQAADRLLQDGENSLFGQVDTESGKKELYESIQTLFDHYNATMKALKTVSGTVNDFYREMLSEVSDEQKEGLSALGITFDKDKTVQVDMAKLKDADPDTVKSLLGSKSEFVQKLTFVSGRISDNARANIASISNLYSANGNISNSGNASSKLDLWG